MNNTKIDWCDCTVNPVIGCKNGCKYCYAERLNKRFHYIPNWKCPQFRPEKLKQFYSKKPRSIFIDSMSDIGTWEQEWFNAVAKAMSENPQHKYIALTKRLDGLNSRCALTTVGIIPNFYVGISVTTQKQADSAPRQIRSMNDYDGALPPDFYSIEPILEPITISADRMPDLLIIGAETGNRKGKVIPQKEWIDNLVRQADAQESTVFMKGSLCEIMGADFRQDRLPWEVVE